MKKGLLFSLSMLLFTGLGYSQVTSEDGHRCGIHESAEQVDAYMKRLFKARPELETQHNDLMQVMQNNHVVNYNPITKSNDTSYVIPVVFHVLHRYGNENISDAMVSSTVDRMNLEFQFNDPDSTTIEPVFKQLASLSAADITFRLATKDPYGNCTNGIEHINTHETFVGDNFSKLNQWDRSHYLNFWTVAQVGVGGAIAYSQKPPSTDGLNFWVDGVLSHYSTINGVSSTSTHEVGHYLDLAHTWNSTQSDPGQLCGDDGVLDTPITKGNSGGCPTNFQDCDTIPENVSNYMNYAACENMFTPGQVDRMYNALLGISGQRNVLWQDTTLLETGTDSVTYSMPLPVCAPVADFNAFDKHLCVGANTTFEDHSWNAVIDSREWTFEDATPATSTSPTVVVTFNSPGWKEVSLTVTSAGGTDTRTESSYIYVSPDWADFEGPALLNVEGNQHYLFLVDNPEDNYAKFTVKDGVGMDGSRAFKLNNYKDISQADPFTSEGWYNDRLGKGFDYLITPSFELRYTTGITVTFDYSYASNASVVNDIDEILKVYSSRNCGETWVARKTITGASLVTGGFAGNSDFTPTANNQWETASFNYTATSLDVKTRFMFEFEASDLASNLYIDNIWVDGVLLVEPSQINDLDLTVYPNPTKGEAINVEYTALDESVKFTLRDMSGKVISTEVVDETNTTVKHQLNGSTNLPAACYFLQVTSGDYSVTKKVVVL